MTDPIALALSIGALLSMLAGWLRWGRPRIRKAKSDGVAMRDAILGRDAVVDTITGTELAPELPGIGVRMAHQEQQQIETSRQMETMAIAVTKLVSQQHAIAELRSEVTGHAEALAEHAEQIAELKAASMERVITRAEAAQAWQAMEAAIKAQPESDRGPDELP